MDTDPDVEAELELGEEEVETILTCLEEINKVLRNAANLIVGRHL